MSEPIKKDLEDFLKAARIVEAINANIPEGLPKLPAIGELQLRALDRDAAGTMLMAGIEAGGGIPGFVAWMLSDPKHQAKVYEWFIKQIPTEQHVEHSGSLVVNGSLGDSPFDEFDPVTDGSEARH